MFSLRASPTAMCSFLVSTIHTALGTLVISRMPPSERSSLAISRVEHELFLLGGHAVPAGLLRASSSFSRCSRL